MAAAPATSSIHFCLECNNLLYAKEDRVRKQLMYVCRRCDYEKKAENPAVYRHEIVKSAVDQLTTIPPEVIHDPALARAPKLCPSCNGSGAVVVQAKPGVTDDKIKLIFVCTSAGCAYKWQE